MNNTSRLKAIAQGAFIGAGAAGIAIQLGAGLIYNSFLTYGLLPPTILLVVGLSIAGAFPTMMLMRSAKSHVVSFLTPAILLSVPASLLWRMGPL